MVGRRGNYFGSIRNETFKKGHGGRARREGGKVGGNKEVRDIFVEKPVFFQDDTGK